MDPGKVIGNEPETFSLNRVLSILADDVRHPELLSIEQAPKDAEAGPDALGPS